MAPPFTRASRPWVFVPSAGASVEIKQIDRNGNLDIPEPGLGTVFDINLGILTDTHLNQDTTNSGDNGGSSFTRVGGIWNYRLSLSFPVGVLGVGALGADRAFAQQLLGSSGYIWMRFNMGDPEFWTDRGLPIRSFVGERSLLSQVEMRVEVGTKQVVGLNIAGDGSSLLRAILQDAPTSPNLQVYP